MFTNLANYLLGMQQPAQEEQEAERPLESDRLKAIEADDDWILVDNNSGSECPVSMETSPLENLLIEHPSMSVYQHSSQSRSPRGRSDSTGGSSNGSTTSEGDGPAAPVRRRSGTVASHQLDKQTVQMRSAQKVRVYRANQVLKRNTLERNNKAREMNSSKNKRERRADRQQQRSCANNDRKSCKSNGKCC